MKNSNRIIPVGIKGNEINDRMKELMGIMSINENKSSSNIELTKIGPDGNAYAIVRENHSYFIKTTNKKENLVKEDFKYIGGYMNRVAYPSYEKAIKHLNLKFNSLAESFDAGHNINVFENDNLLNENGLAGGFADHPKGGGFTGEGNLEGNTPMYTEEAELTEEEEKTKNNPWAICTSSVGRDDKAKYEACVKDVKKEKGIKEEITENEYCEDDVELTEVEKAVDEMMDEEKEIKNPGKYIKGEKSKLGIDDDGDGVPNGADKDPKDGSVNEHKLSIRRALEQMDSIIDTLSEGTVKKKAYTIK